MRSLTRKLTALYHRSRANSWKRRASSLRRDLSDVIWTGNKHTAWCERQAMRHTDRLREESLKSVSFKS